VDSKRDDIQYRTLIAMTVEHPITIEPLPAGGFRLSASQWVPQPREQVFALFSDAFQLEALTPPWLKFAVLTPAPIEIAAGTLIDYRLRLHGVPIRWQSRISVWEPPVRFVDEQTRGPYRRWHHEHVFAEVDGGTLCRDTVDYRPLGGWLANSLLVRRDLLKVFTYRQQQLGRLLEGSVNGHERDTPTDRGRHGQKMSTPTA
jgi:ligand-binding SRPBCC domain-containing protein